jgi:hypothetical protein
LQIAFLLEHRLGRVELDHAGWRVTAEQRALRAAQHLDLVDVKYREAFQHGVFLDDVVHHQADRLRGVQVEVGVAQAADVEAREGTAIVGFDVDRRRAAGQEADVGGARGQHVQLVAFEGGDRHRHVLDVFRAALGRHDHGFQLVLVGWQRRLVSCASAAAATAAASCHGRAAGKRWRQPGRSAIALRNCLACSYVLLP